MNNLVHTTPRTLGAAQPIGPLAFGCWRLVNMPVAEAQALVETALDLGMNLVDNADVYGLDWGGDAFGAAEALLGDVLATAPALRERMVLATKGGIIPGIPYDSARLKAACEASLERLKVEQVDLYQIHRPDLLAHPEETARVLEDLVASGKVREVGVSNFQPSQTRALAHYLNRPLVSQQFEYSALAWQPLFDGVFDQCLELGMTVLAWSPLAGGRLGDSTGLAPELAGVLEELAAREAVDISTIALAFTLAHPSRPVPILGTTRPQRLQAAQRALQVHLDRADVYRILQTAMGEALP